MVILGWWRLLEMQTMVYLPDLVSSDSSTKIKWFFKFDCFEISKNVNYWVH